MIAGQTCPKCGTTLSKDALGGLCRKCLGRLAFARVLDNGSPPDSAAESHPHWFGDYELLEEIARGGMGVVYKARQISLDRVVAVKMILHGPFSSEEFLRRFRVEAQSAARLHHPNIVPVYEVGQCDGQHYFSMEYIEGRNLAEVVRERPLSPRRAAAYVKSISEAMHYAHEQGILHRDLKPSNVLLDMFDEPRVTDFGLAKLLTGDLHLTITGQALGSPHHMPPEQIAGKHDASPRGDIYSLGAILYHLVTGRPPFQSETLPEVLAQVQTAEPIPPRRLNSSVPLDLQTICLKCLQKDAGRRYATAQALADDLGRFLEHQPIVARPVPAVQRLWLWCQRRPVPAALSGGLLLAVFLGLAGILNQWLRAEHHALGEESQRKLAEASAAKLRLNLYAADINLAWQAIKGADYGLARRTLAALQPQPGEPDLRGFEWRYLLNLCRGDESATLTGHTWIVTCVAFSPDSRLLVSGSQDGMAKVWDAAHGQAVTTLEDTNGSIWSVAFSPDGRLLMTSSRLGTKFWDTNDWRLVTNFPGTLAALSGTLVATSESSPFSWEAVGPVTIWDYKTGERLGRANEPGRTLAFSPDGRTLAVAGSQNGITLYEVGVPGPDFALKPKRRLSTTASVWSLRFSPDGRRLLSAGWTDHADVWDLAGTDSPQHLKGHLRTVWFAGFSADGNSIFTTSSDQTIRLWDAVSLRPQGIFRGHDNEVWCAAASPDGKLLASGGKDQTVRLWPPKPPAPGDRLPHTYGFRPAFSPDGTRLALLGPGSSAGQRHPQLWDVRSRKLLAVFPSEDAAGFSPDGSRIVLFNEEAGILESCAPGAQQQPAVHLAQAPRARAASTQRGFSPDWKQVFIIDQDGVVRVWDAETGNLLRAMRGPRPPIRAAVLGPSGRHFAVSVERENVVRLFDTVTGREQHLSAHRDFVSGIGFSPDGTTLATGSMDGTLRLWAVATGQPLAALPGHPEEVTDVAFSPDGRTLASLGHLDALKLWHVATLRELLTVDFPNAGALFQFSPNGRHLAVNTEEGPVRLFDAP